VATRFVETTGTGRKGAGGGLNSCVVVNHRLDAAELGDAKGKRFEIEYEGD